jgi:AcrR family transcriptional regulator
MSRTVMIAAMTDHDIMPYAPPMPRWKPEGQTRLIVAALELFESDGFEGTTVAAIAERAQLTERTFYRYFEDKREVLFAGTVHLEELIAAEISAAPTTGSMKTVIDAMKAIAKILEDQRDFGLRRSVVIAANSELRERELVKIAHLADCAATSLVERGVVEAEARMAAEVGAMVFKSSFDRWTSSGATESLSGLMDDSYAELCRLMMADTSTP